MPHAEDVPHVDDRDVMISHRDVCAKSVIRQMNSSTVYYKAMTDYSYGLVCYTCLTTKLDV